MENLDFFNKCQEDNTIIISSGDRLTIENSVDFAKCIRKALTASQSVSIKFDDPLEMDITALQVLCSACKTAMAEGKTFAYQGNEAESLQKLIASAGAERLGNCRHNNNNPCACFGGRH